MKAALGLDVGTTSVKAVVVDENGQFVDGGKSGVLRMRSPEPGWAVQATSDLYEAVVDCLTSAAESLPTDIDVLSLTVASQSGSLVTVDKADNVADDMTTWMDTRSRSIVEAWHRDGTADVIRAHSGWTVHPGQGLPQLAWLRAHNSELWGSIGHIAAADDLVTNWLTGTWTTNPSNAAGTALIDLASGQWSPTLREIAEIELSQLSKIRRSGYVLGPLTPELANATGLGSELVVVSGGHDQACTALALGVTDPAQALLAGGTAWVLTTVIRDSADDVSNKVPVGMNVSFHVAPGLRTASTYLGGIGASIEWWLNASKLQGGGRDRFVALNHEISAVTTTAESPYFRPVEDASDTQPGAGIFVNSNARTTDLDRARSIMEYAAFALNTALLSLPADLRPTVLNLVGGVTQSPIWSQLIADICAIQVVRSVESSLPAIGAAVLGGVATGIFESDQAALGTLGLSSEHIYPNLQSAELSRHRYQIHLEQESKQ